jgi:ascorbate PTS system EIIA or EIIAB component
MNEAYFTEDNVQFNVDALDWQDAINKSVSLLRKNGFVNEEYASQVIKSVEEYGPYIVISPGIAIPHTRPENGALAVGVSLITLKNPIYIKDSEKPVKVMISFSATDNNQHLEIIKMIVTIIENGLVDNISSINSVDDLNNLIGEGKT